jgi:hypothetical protein
LHWNRIWSSKTDSDCMTKEVGLNKYKRISILSLCKMSVWFCNTMHTLWWMILVCWKECWVVEKWFWRSFIRNLLHIEKFNDRERFLLLYILWQIFQVQWRETGGVILSPCTEYHRSKCVLRTLLIPDFSWWFKKVTKGIYPWFRIYQEL